MTDRPAVVVTRREYEGLERNLRGEPVQIHCALEECPRIAEVRYEATIDGNFPVVIAFCARCAGSDRATDLIVQATALCCHRAEMRRRDRT